MTQRQREIYLNTARELDRAKARIHNLNLYLDYVRQVAPELFGAMMDEFDGLPGFGNDVKYAPDYRAEGEI